MIKSLLGIFDKSESSPQAVKEKANVRKIQGQAPPRKTSVTTKTIQRLENMPAHNGLAKDKEGKLIVHKDAWKEDYIVLYADPKHQTVFIVSSIDSKAEKGINPVVLSLRNNCKNSGLIVTNSYHATKSVIASIYAMHGTSSVRVQDEENGKVKRSFLSLVLDAVKQDVSDIHIEVRQETADIRFRSKGDLIQYDEMSVTQATDMATVVYNVMAEDKDLTFNQNTMQDAVIDATLETGMRVRIRLATTPAAPSGFDMVLRILPTAVKNDITLEKLGYSEEQVKDLSLAVSQPVGIIIVAGVTGSGKSTSLACMLSNKIRDAEFKIKVITVENPPENLIEGATQVPVVISRDSKGGQSPFAKAIKAAMRLDPDVLMIGEIRDEDSADLGVHATQSGHQALATLHAPSAFSVPERLRGLGLKSQILGSNDFFAGIIYQSLAQLTCQHCCFNYHEWAGTIRTDMEKMLNERINRVFRIEDMDNLVFRNKKGCPKCNNGISGREVIAEVVVPNREMREAIGRNDDSEAEKIFLRNGGLTVLQMGIEKAKKGMIDVRDLEKKAGLIDGVIELVKLSGLPFDHFGYRQPGKEHERPDPKHSTPRRAKPEDTVLRSASQEEKQKQNKVEPSIGDKNLTKTPSPDKGAMAPRGLRNNQKTAQQGHSKRVPPRK